MRANTALSLSKAQHVREVQELQEQIGVNTQEQLSNVHMQLAEQQSKTQQLEVQLHSQAQQARIHLNLQQVHFSHTRVHPYTRTFEETRPPQMSSGIEVPFCSHIYLL